MSDPIDFDALVDPQLGALLTLCFGAINANVKLADDSPDAMVRSAYPWPVPRKMLSSVELPLLTISRQSETTFQRTTAQPYERKVVFAFEYTMPIVNDARAGLRWPALANVWGAILRAVTDGHDPAVAADANILTAAGFMDLDETERGRMVTYEKPDPRADVFPAFVGLMTLSHRDDFDISALQDLVDLDARIRLNGLPDNEQPLVEQIIKAPPAP